MELETLVALATGAVALYFGRRVLWLAVAALGFLVGFLILPELFAPAAEWSEGVRIGVGAALGVVLAVMARTVTKFVAAIFGFIFAATFAVPLVEGLELVSRLSGGSQLLVVVGTGLVGAVIAYVMVDPALIVLTALWGGTQMMRVASTEWDVPPGWYGLVLAALVGTGLYVQFKHR